MITSPESPQKCDITISSALERFRPLVVRAAAAYRTGRKYPLGVSCVGVPVALSDWPSQVAELCIGFDQQEPAIQDGRLIVLEELQSIIVEGKDPAILPTLFDRKKVTKRAARRKS